MFMGGKCFKSAYVGLYISLVQKQLFRQIMSAPLPKWYNLHINNLESNALL